MSGWRHEPFDKVIADESGGNLKTPQSEFLPSGRFAIVDQGKELVSGYTNDESRLCRAQLPVIVFGDHTRCFKYVDFPFCMGADGVKVLRPKIEADVKYLYHYLRQLRLTEGGYDRHFKYLKRSSVALPPLPEQRRIAEILDKADAQRAKRRAALAQLDTLTQSIFLDMFGDPATNPKGWPVQTLSVVSERITKGESPKWQGFDYQDDGALFVTSENVRLGEIDLSDPKFIPLEFNAKLSRSELRPGDLLVNLVGASIGRSCVFPGFNRPANINQAVAVVTIDRSRIEHVFVAGLLVSSQGQRLLLGNKVEAARANISLADLRALPLPTPPRELQRDYARRVAQVAEMKSLYGSSAVEFNALFASLQHRAFQGEL